MNDFRTFDAAVKAFEHQFNCRLCLHDYIGRFKGCTLPNYHLNPYCSELKKRRPGAERVCTEFDHHCIVRRHGNPPGPFYKYCPFGYLEAVFPIMVEGKVCGAIFAGPFNGAPPRLPEAYRENALLPNCVKRQPSPLKFESRHDLLALGELLAEQLAVSVNRSWPGGGSRREMIEQFIGLNYSRPIGLEELAEFIGLSPARASEQVKKLFGESFSTLLNRERLRMARLLLEHSAFNIDMVAERCGFSDSAYFHRVFRRYCGETPTAYRRHTASQIKS